MVLARRSFLRVLAATPLATKSMSEKATAKAVGINIDEIGQYGSPIQGTVGGVSTSQYKYALSNKTIKELYESQLYQANKSVSYSDIDLANKRSFSLAAKITFQRQRNVERELDNVQNGYPWAKLQNIITRFIDPLSGVKT